MIIDPTNLHDDFTLNVPLIAISYGDFAESKKLYSYEELGRTYMPVFTDPVVAQLFISSTKEIVSTQLNIVPVVCNDIQHAIDMFEVISVMCDQMTVILNPKPFTEEHLARLNNYNSKITPKIYSIYDVIQSLNGLKSESHSK